MARARNKDRRLLLYLCGGALVAVLAIGFLNPKSNENDPRPTIDNDAPGGARAAYLMLKELGRPVDTWDDPLADLGRVDAAHTTLVLAAPSYDEKDRAGLAASVKEFLQRGGHVLATGKEGAALLPDSGWAEPTVQPETICQTTPQGPGTLAHAGSVEMAQLGRWTKTGPPYRIEHQCGDDAVVARYTVGNGEAIWWASASPLTNRLLGHDADLKLLLASLGDGRNIYFDESLHNPADALWSKVADLPLNWLKLQALIIAVLLLLSYSRRRGPLLPVAAMPRTSPVEFAVSMGALYEKAGAVSAAVEAAQRRLTRVLHREAGLPLNVIADGPHAVSLALEQRLGGDWSGLVTDMEAAMNTGQKKLTPREALAIVKALAKDIEEIRSKLHPATKAVSAGSIVEQSA